MWQCIGYQGTGGLSHTSCVEKRGVSAQRSIRFLEDACGLRRRRVGGPRDHLWEVLKEEGGEGGRGREEGPEVSWPAYPW